MSRHDRVLERAERRLKAPVAESGDENLIIALTEALEEEIKAHAVTRIARNKHTEHVASLLGNVRGLESKVRGLQAELEQRQAVFSDGGATSYHEGYLAGLVAAKAAIEALEK